MSPEGFLFTGQRFSLKAAPNHLPPIQIGWGRGTSISSTGVGLSLSALTWDKSYLPSHPPTLALSFYVCKMKVVIPTSQSSVVIKAKIKVKAPQVNKRGNSEKQYANRNPEMADH